jgi:LmbE family N-acetylglucosaminyl deacetylase
LRSERMAKRMVVFAPHPDDETLGCGGTIAQRVTEGWDVFVVFMTDGRYAFIGPPDSAQATFLEMKKIRKEEAMCAAKDLGVEDKNLLFLDFEDTKLKKNEKNVQKRIEEILQIFSPDEVFFPQEREFHSDHRTTNMLVREALKTLDIHPVQYTYIIAWCFPFYLLQRVFSDRFFDKFMSSFLGNKITKIDISRFTSLKKKAIDEYKSQTTLMFKGQRHPALKYSFTQRFWKAQERFFIRR